MPNVRTTARMNNIFSICSWNYEYLCKLKIKQDVELQPITLCFTNAEIRSEDSAIQYERSNSNIDDLSQNNKSDIFRVNVKWFRKLIRAAKEC